MTEFKTYLHNNDFSKIEKEINPKYLKDDTLKFVFHKYNILADYILKNNKIEINSEYLESTYNFLLELNINIEYLYKTLNILLENGVNISYTKNWNLNNISYILQFFYNLYIIQKFIILNYNLGYNKCIIKLKELSLFSNYIYISDLLQLLYKYNFKFDSYIKITNNIKDSYINFYLYDFLIYDSELSDFQLYLEYIELQNYINVHNIINNPSRYHLIKQVLTETIYSAHYSKYIDNLYLKLQFLESINCNLNMLDLEKIKSTDLNYKILKCNIVEYITIFFEYDEIYNILPKLLKLKIQYYTNLYFMTYLEYGNYVYRNYVYIYNSENTLLLQIWEMLYQSGIDINVNYIESDIKNLILLSNINTNNTILNLIVDMYITESQSITDPKISTQNFETHITYLNFILTKNPDILYKLNIITFKNCIIKLLYSSIQNKSITDYIDTFLYCILQCLDLNLFFRSYDSIKNIFNINLNNSEPYTTKLLFLLLKISNNRIESLQAIDKLSEFEIFKQGIKEFI